MTLQSNNINNNSFKSLSVQLSLSGLSFLIINSNTNKVEYFFEKNFSNTKSPEELLIEIKSCFELKNELNATFNKVTAIYATNLYSIVPTTLFDASKASDYLKFNAKILANDFVAYDAIESQDITIVYIPFININNYLFEKFGDFDYYHSSSILLKHLLEKDNISDLPKVFINVIGNLFHLIIIKNKKLQFANSYNFNTPEDFIYYILFSLEQLKLNPDTVDAYISGSINKDDEKYAILYNYIRNISFYKYSNTLVLSENDLPHQQLLLKLV